MSDMLSITQNDNSQNDLLNFFSDINNFAVDMSFKYNLTSEIKSAKAVFDQIKWDSFADQNKSTLQRTFSKILNPITMKMMKVNG